MGGCFTLVVHSSGQDTLPQLLLGAAFALSSAPLQSSLADSQWLELHC